MDLSETAEAHLGEVLGGCGHIGLAAAEAGEVFVGLGVVRPPGPRVQLVVMGPAPRRRLGLEAVAWETQTGV